jgi:hypothetical protein
MMPPAYCEPVRDSEWRSTDSWKEAEEKPVAKELRRHIQFVKWWNRVISRETSADTLLARLFIAHAEKWEKETGHLSSTTKRVMHPSYQSIIGMGPSVVPILLKDLEKNHRIWFWALVSITGQNPVKPEDAGDVRQMAEAWIDWGKRTGRI